ncbi:MAG TPA: Fic family protein, partial [Cellvibrio sp.]|nr:Fic family protein [Cellvibrio sp.]
MIKTPPPASELPQDPLRSVAEAGLENSLIYANYVSPVDERGRYLPFDEFRHRVPKSLQVNLAWALLKRARNTSSESLFGVIPSLPKLGLLLISNIQKTISLVDQTTTSAAL